MREPWTSWDAREREPEMVGPPRVSAEKAQAIMSDRLRTPRGVALGVVLGAVVWALVAVAAYLLLR